MPYVHIFLVVEKCHEAVQLCYVTSSTIGGEGLNRIDLISHIEGLLERSHDLYKYTELLGEGLRTLLILTKKSHNNRMSFILKTTP